MRAGRWIPLLLGVAFCAPAQAMRAPAGLANAWNCGDINVERIRLATAGSNLANQNTTRTPEGGAYRPSRIDGCGNGGCAIRREGRFVLKYLPNHPDADKNGYVRYPDIDPKDEYANLNMAANKLRSMAGEGVCGAKVLENQNTSILRYRASDVREDALQFDKDGKVVTWSRTSTNGQTKMMEFRGTGDISSVQVR